ncbi:protein of unknown function [Cyanobium sp. NIES-981]|nr:protein of unknown function [Cyanobium sp. NIES-981]
MPLPSEPRAAASAPSAGAYGLCASPHRRSDHLAGISTLRPTEPFGFSAFPLAERRDPVPDRCGPAHPLRARQGRRQAGALVRPRHRPHHLPVHGGGLPHRL